MLDLRTDGTIAIDFDQEGGPLIVRRPKVGALKRCRAEMARIADKSVEYLASLEPAVLSDLEAEGTDDEDGAAADRLTRTQFVRMSEERYEADSLEWWGFVLRGDESFAGLAEGPVPDEEDWPAYLASPVSTAWAISHWKSVPLARGGTLVPPTR